MHRDSLFDAPIKSGSLGQDLQQVGIDVCGTEGFQESRATQLAQFALLLQEHEVLSLDLGFQASQLFAEVF